MKFTAGQCPNGNKPCQGTAVFPEQHRAGAELISWGLDISFYHSHNSCNLMPGQFSRMENVYFLSSLATMSSVSTCGTEGFFSAGLDVLKICSTYFPCSHTQFLLSLDWSEHGCDPGTALSVSVMPLGSWHGVGARNFGNLPQKRTTLRQRS